MIIVSDTSPISALIRVGKLDLLRLLFGRVVIPTTVFNELLELKNFDADLRELLTADWIEVRSPRNLPEVERLFIEIHRGEAEAITLSKEIQADFLVIDERDGRSVALREGLRIIGLLGILRDLKRAGHLTAIKPLLDQMMTEANFRISPSLYRAFLNDTGEQV